MKTTSLNTAFTQLQEAMKKLRLRWQETSLHWNDAVQREFEEQFQAPLEARVHETTEEMDRLDKVMIQAQKECE